MSRLSVLLSLAASLACSFGAADARYRQCKDLNREFLVDRSEEERATLVSNQEISKQYEIYQCGMETRHPRPLDLVEVVAANGESAVPFLQNELESESADQRIVNIVYIFNWMKLKQTYDVAGDVGLIELIKSKIDSMKDDYLRSVAAKNLQEILNGPAQQANQSAPERREELR